MQENKQLPFLEVETIKRELFSSIIVRYRQAGEQINNTRIGIMPKKTIKIIKKSERNRKPAIVPKNNPAREAAREMVQTVTNWVNELQQNKRAETAEALKMLLTKTPRPSEA